MSVKNKLSLSVQYPDERLKEVIPRTKVRRWVAAALFAPAELTVRFVDAEEGRALNRDYRGKDYATNVLTFAYNEGESAEEKMSRRPTSSCVPTYCKRKRQNRKNRLRPMPRIW